MALCGNGVIYKKKQHTHTINKQKDVYVGKARDLVRPPPPDVIFSNEAFFPEGPQKCPLNHLNVEVLVECESPPARSVNTATVTGVRRQATGVHDGRYIQRQATTIGNL